LENTLQQAANDTSIDWIIVQMHQTAVSSSGDNGSDLGIRQVWLPLFDQYQVDLVLCGHDHDYERSFPIRGFNHNQGTGISASTAGNSVSVAAASYGRAGQTGVETLQPNPVTTNSALTTFDTTQGTVHLILGGGGTNAPDNGSGTSGPYGGYGPGSTINGQSVRAAGVNTYTNPKVIATANKQLPDTWEPAIYSANIDTTDAYGIAQFTVDPGSGPGDTTTLTLNYYHAPAVAPASSASSPLPSAPSYQVLETITFTRPRSDGASGPVRYAGSPGEDLPEFPNPVVAVGAAAAVGAGAAYLKSRSNKKRDLIIPAPSDN
jgi:alkaline phosphatase D